MIKNLWISFRDHLDDEKFVVLVRSAEG